MTQTETEKFHIGIRAASPHELVGFIEGYQIYIETLNKTPYFSDMLITTPQEAWNTKKDWYKNI